MKTREQIEHVEPEEGYDYKRTFYVCEANGCTFETEEEEDYKKHYGKEHAVKEEREVCNRTFYRFETEEDQKCYVEAKDDHFSSWYADWNGPGWYGEDGRQEPCRRGCCTNYSTYLEPASFFEEKWRKERDNLNAKVDQIQPLL